MKNLIKYLIIGLTLIGCQNTSSTEISRSKNTEKLREFVSSFQGTWINREYVETLLTFNSPYKAQQEHPYYLIYIKPDYIKDNVIGIYDYEYRQTEINPTKYYNLENGYLEYSYRMRDGVVVSDTCQENCDKITYTVQNMDTILLVERGNQDITELKRINSKCIDDDHTCEITKLITANILAGQYELLDSTKALITPNLTIDENGLIDNYEKYQRAILWDFFYEVNWPYKYDVLQFIPSSHNIGNYGFYNDNDEYLFKFEITNDTLRLRSTMIDEENNEVKTGNTEYYLIKK